MAAAESEGLMSALLLTWSSFSEELVAAEERVSLPVLRCREASLLLLLPLLLLPLLLLPLLLLPLLTFLCVKGRRGEASGCIEYHPELTMLTRPSTRPMSPRHDTSVPASPAEPSSAPDPRTRASPGPRGGFPILLLPAYFNALGGTGCDEQVRRKRADPAHRDGVCALVCTASESAGESRSRPRSVRGVRRCSKQGS